jgi:hypothetical protein
MKNKLRDLLICLDKYGTVATGVLSTESYFRGIRKDLKIDPVVSDLIEQNKAKNAVIQENLEYTITNEVMKTNIENKVEIGRKSIDKLEKAYEKMNEFIKGSGNSSTSNFISIDNIKDRIIEFQNFLDTLPLNQIGAIVNISFCFFYIIMCIYFNWYFLWTRINRIFPIRTKISKISSISSIKKKI